MSRTQKKAAPLKEEPVVQEQVKKKSLLSRMFRATGKQIKRFIKFIRKNPFKTLLVIAVLVGLGWFGNEYMNTKDQIKQLTNPKTAGQTEVQIITNDVKQVLDLPKNEEPTLATVSDITKLKNQTFFKNAQNGDKVLIYVKSGRALLYRPVENKVIEYSAVNLQSTKEPSSQPASVQPQPQTTPAQP